MHTGAAGTGAAGTGPADTELTGTEPARTEPADGDPGDAESVARLLCLRQLEDRARTRVELARYLARKGVPDTAASKVLDRLTDVGLIDDAALAESFTASRQTYQGLAGKAIAVKLRQRGVADHTIAAAIANTNGASILSNGMVDPADETATAYRLAAKKAPTLARLEPDVRLRRLVGLLGRKGYSSGLAYRVAREVLSTTGPTSVGLGADDAADDDEVG